MTLKPCPFCGFDDCYLSDKDECIVCPACEAQGPTDWKRFGDTELIPMEMWEKRAPSIESSSRRRAVERAWRMRRLLFQSIVDCCPHESTGKCDEKMDCIACWMRARKEAGK